jgi:aspartyl-tRNA(Asn)/glutamyl-tRNA(Gln) amidotransferase subunit B
MSVDDYEITIGLEIHVQLATTTKMFSPVETYFGAEPNTLVGPVDLGLPGTLPVPNAQAIHFGIMLGLAFNCAIADRLVFHRKNYFYPDLPKGYQISQFDEPLCGPGNFGGVRIHRVHLEEDAAKLTHAGASGRIHDSDSSIVDFNRGGTALAEIVTEPDVHSAEQASEWLRLLRTTVRQLGVSDVNMEEGSLRCDANISIAPKGSTELGAKTELKNMNSFRFIERGIRAEVARQAAILDAGGTVEQETLHFDPRTEAITSMRSKEDAHDYRYFPEPDMVPVVVTPEMLAAAKAAMPELPHEREERFIALGVEAGAARQMSWQPELGDLFEAALAADGSQPKALAALITNELVARLGDGELSDSKAEPAALAQLVALTADGKVSTSGARTVLGKLIESGGDPAAIIDAEGLGAIGGGDTLTPIVEAALAANPDVAEKLKTGDMKPIGVIVGFVMKETKGRADGKEVTKVTRQLLGL